MDYSDDRIFVSLHCGPASRRFQELLAEAGIATEIRTNRGPQKWHEYLLLGANIASDMVNLIIDPTYRQFLRWNATDAVRQDQGDDFTDLDIQNMIMSYDVPQVLVARTPSSDESDLVWWYESLEIEDWSGFAGWQQYYEPLANPDPAEQVGYPPTLP